MSPQNSQIAATIAPRLPLIKPTLVALLLVALILLPQFVTRDDILNLSFRVCLFVALAQSWNIIGGLAGQTNLGHAAFFGIGALITRTLWLGGLPFPVAFVLGGLVAALAGIVVGLPTFRLRGVYFAVGTLVIAEALRITVEQSLPLITTLPLADITTYDIGARYYLALAVALAVTLAAIALRRSALGLGLDALREDDVAASATGVNVLAHKLLALVLASFFAGLAGGVFAFQQVSYYPAAAFDNRWTFDALLITYVGGVGTAIGPMIGALFFILLQDQLALYLERGHQIIFGVLFILVVLVFPGGLGESWSWLRYRLGARRSGKVQ